MTVRCPYDFMGPAKASYGDLAGSLRLSQECTIIFGPRWQSKTLRCPHDHRTVPVRGSYDVTAMCLRATGLRFFSNLSLCGVKQNRRGHDARKSVRWSKVSLRRRYGNGDLDIVRASYTRNKANVTEALAPFICKWGLFRNWFWRFKVPRNFGNLKYPTRVHSWVRTDGVDLLLDLLSLRPRR